MAATEISLSITPQEDGKWMVVCTGAVARYAVVAPPLSGEEIGELRKCVHEGARRCKVDESVFRSHSQVCDEWTERLKATGVKLFNGVMQGKLSAAYREAAARAREGLRVRVCSDHPDVVSYPWELLCEPDRGGFLSRRNGSTLVRSGENIGPALPAITKPLRVLIVAASPRDYPQLDWENEERLIKECVDVKGECEVKTISGSIRATNWKQ